MCAAVAGEQSGGGGVAAKQRVSKFKHVFGRSARKDACYENVHVTSAAHDGSFCAVNPRFVAVVVEAAGGGAFVILPIKKVGRADPGLPRVCGHAGPVTDLKWCPFDDCLIASCSEDMTVKIWEIPEDGLDQNMMECAIELRGHTRRVALIEWHPTAAHVILSAGFDFKCIVWNTYTAETLRIISCHDSAIQSIAWNRDGSLFVTASKDRKIRVIDPRVGRVLQEGQGHEGLKQQKVLFVTDANTLFSTGFSKTGDREFAVWNADDLSQPLMQETVDYSSGVLLPFYDYDTRIVYLAGKGDGNIRYYEVTAEPPYALYLSQYPSSEPQRGLGWMPKRGLDLRQYEIARFYKVHAGSKQIIEPLAMIIPRRSDEFQEDVYPPTAAPTPAMSAREWLSGVNRAPVLLDLKPLYDMAGSSAEEDGRRSNASRTASTTGSRRGSFSGAKPVPANHLIAAAGQHVPAAAASPPQQQPQTQATPAALPASAPASLKNILKLSTDHAFVSVASKGHGGDGGDVVRPPPSEAAPLSRHAAGIAPRAASALDAAAATAAAPVAAERRAPPLLPPQFYGGGSGDASSDGRSRRLASQGSQDAVDGGGGGVGIYAPASPPASVARSSVERSPSPYDKKPTGWQENAAFKPPQPPTIHLNSQLLAPPTHGDPAPQQQPQRQRSASADIRFDFASVQRGREDAPPPPSSQLSYSLLQLAADAGGASSSRNRGSYYGVESQANVKMTGSGGGRASQSASDIAQLTSAAGGMLRGGVASPSGRYSPSTVHRLDDESFVILHGQPTWEPLAVGGGGGGRAEADFAIASGERSSLRDRSSAGGDGLSEVERKKSLKRMKQAIRRSHSASRIEGRESPSPERDVMARDDCDGDRAAAAAAAARRRRPAFKEALLLRSSLDGGGDDEDDDEEEKSRVRRKLEALRKLRDEAKAYASGEVTPASHGSPEGSRLSPAKSPGLAGGAGAGEWAAAAQGLRLSPTRYYSPTASTDGTTKEPAAVVSLAVAAHAPTPATAEARMISSSGVVVAPTTAAPVARHGAADGKVVASSTYSPAVSVAAHTTSQAPGMVYWSPPGAAAKATSTSVQTLELRQPASPPTRRAALVYSSGSGGKEAPKSPAAHARDSVGSGGDSAHEPAAWSDPPPARMRPVPLRSAAAAPAAVFAQQQPTPPTVAAQQATLAGREAGAPAVSSYATSATRTATGPYYDAREMTTAVASGRQQPRLDVHRKAHSLDAGEEGGRRQPLRAAAPPPAAASDAAEEATAVAPVAARARAPASFGSLRYTSLSEAEEPRPQTSASRPKSMNASETVDYRAVAAERARQAGERRSERAVTAAAEPSTAAAGAPPIQPKQQQQQTNGSALSNDELHKAYFRQVEEIKSLRGQLAARDRRIELLEREVMRLQGNS